MCSRFWKESSDLPYILCDIDWGVDIIPFKISLSVIWDLETDSFTFKMSFEENIFSTRCSLKPE